MRLFSLKNDIYINSVTVTYTKKNTGKGYFGLIGKHNKLLILDFFKILASLESISNLLYYHFLNNGVLLLLTDSTVLKARLVAEFSKLKNVFVSNNCQVGQISSPQFFNNFFPIHIFQIELQILE